MNIQKLAKYLHKYDNHAKKNYLEKIQYYLQSGGSPERIIQGIVSKELHMFYEIYRKMPESECREITGDLDIPRHTDYRCIKVSNNMSCEYLFKRLISAKLTDYFMERMSGELYEKMFFDIYDIFNNSIRLYVDAYNNVNARKLDYNDIKIFFKGGNVFNIYYNKLAHAFTSDITSYHHFTEFYGSLFEYKLSDIDFSVEISKNLDPETYSRIMEDIKKLSFICMNELKKKVDTEYEYVINVENVVQKILKDIVMNKQIIENYFKSITIKCPEPKLIEMVQIFAKNIQQSNVANTERPYAKHSTAITQRQTSDASMRILDIYNMTRVLDRPNPEYEIQTHSSLLTYNDSIKYVSNDVVFNFCLLRLRIPSLMTHVDKTNFNAYIDLLDCSMTYYDDHTYQSTGRHVFAHSDKPKFTTLHYKDKIFDIPSAYYLYEDLCVIPKQTTVIWEDQKWSKRIGRLLLISWLCFLYDKPETNDFVELEKYVIAVISLLENINRDNRSGTEVLHNKRYYDVFINDSGYPEMFFMDTSPSVPIFKPTRLNPIYFHALDSMLVQYIIFSEMLRTNRPVSVRGAMYHKELSVDIKEQFDFKYGTFIHELLGYYKKLRGLINTTKGGRNIVVPNLLHPRIDVL